MAEPDTVQIRVQGWIGERWASWFDGMAITYEGQNDGSAVTVLTGPVVDQAALRSLLNRLWDLNLAIVSVERAEIGAEQGGGKSNE